MILKLDKETTLQMIEVYMREQMDMDGKASVTVKKDWTGYGMSEREECVVEFKICGKMKLMGREVDMESTLSTEEVKNAIKYCMEKEGHMTGDIHINKGLENKTTGYGMGEKTEEKPYFKGIEVTVKNKEKKLGGK